MRQVRVGLKERSYPILIGSGLLNDLGRHLKASGLAGRYLIIVTQKNIWFHHGKTVLEALAREGFESALFVTPSAKSSEASKTQAVWTRLLKFLASKDGKNRPLAVLALGGGVIGDLAGFAAAVYRRGTPYAQVPTTLTAQVDSSIGGKTGIDLPQGKNLLGTIYQPAVVVCDTSVLGSLPERNWSDGFAEVIKYGVIRDPALFALLEKKGLNGVRQDARLLEKVIERCAKIKAAVVAADEFDKTGVRIILNFGHTVGHAVEAASQYSRAYTHGEAVGVGMLVATDIARDLDVLEDARLGERIESTLIKFHLPVYTKGLSADAVMKAVGYDKKAVQRKNRFVLPVRLGRTRIVSDVPEAVILRAVEKRKG
jgi:3-dehydroquinate synthase